MSNVKAQMSNQIQSSNTVTQGFSLEEYDQPLRVELQDFEF
jgi:hypothetical protein